MTEVEAVQVKILKMKAELHRLKAAEIDAKVAELTRPLQRRGQIEVKPAEFPAESPPCLH